MLLLSQCTASVQTTIRPVPFLLIGPVRTSLVVAPVQVLYINVDWDFAYICDVRLRSVTVGFHHAFLASRAEEKFAPMRDIRGTYAYSAPEVQFNRTGTAYNGRMADVWSM